MGSTRLSTVWVDTQGDLDRSFVYDVVVSTEPWAGVTWATACSNPTLKPESLGRVAGEHLGWRPVSTKIAPAHLKLSDETAQWRARSAMLAASLALRELELGLSEAEGTLWIASGELGARVHTAEPGSAPVSSFEGERSRDMLVAKAWTVARWALDRGRDRVRLLLPRDDARRLRGIEPRGWEDVLAEQGYDEGFVRTDADEVVLRVPEGLVHVEVVGVRDVQHALESLHPSVVPGRSRAPWFGAVAVAALAVLGIATHDADEPVELVPLPVEELVELEVEPPLEPPEPIAIVPLVEPRPPALTCEACDASSSAAARSAWARYPDAGDLTLKNLRVRPVDGGRLLFVPELAMVGCADGYRGVPSVFTDGVGFDADALGENVRDLVSHCLDP